MLTKLRPFDILLDAGNRRELGWDSRILNRKRDTVFQKIINF
ncbi:MAG: hypothetical protein ACE5KJ_06660 [Candidatus Zixiibacteriota bacterium]